MPLCHPIDEGQSNKSAGHTLAVGGFSAPRDHATANHSANAMCMRRALGLDAGIALLLHHRVASEPEPSGDERGARLAPSGITGGPQPYVASKHHIPTHPNFSLTSEECHVCEKYIDLR